MNALSEMIINLEEKISCTSKISNFTYKSADFYLVSAVDTGIHGTDVSENKGPKNQKSMQEQLFVQINNTHLSLKISAGSRKKSLLSKHTCAQRSSSIGHSWKERKKIFFLSITVSWQFSYCSTLVWEKPCTG